MSRYIVDASVGAKWFFEEPHTPEAAALLDARFELHAPDLVLLEVDNVVCKRLRRDQISRTDADAVREALRRMPLVLHETAGFLDPAFEIAAATGRSIYDCVYVALAFAVDGQMVTADRRLLEGMLGSPFEECVVWIDEASSQGSR